MALRAAVDANPIAGATFGVVVMEATSGRVLFSAHGADALNPASNTKLLTAAAALSLLGPSSTYETALHGAREGAVARSVALVGEGDPSLRARDLDALAAELAASGVRTVEGDIALDDARFGAQHLPPAFEQRPDEQAAYRASVSALAIDEAAITLNLRGGMEGVRCDAWATPDGAVVVEGEAIVAGRAALTSQFDAMADGRLRVVVGGRCTTGPTVIRRRVEDPTRVVGFALAAALRRHGITHAGSYVLGAPAPRPPQLASHRSLPLSTLLYEVGKDSNNFTAEMTLLAIGAAAQSPASFVVAAERVVGWARARGVETAGLVLRNGSGLYDANRMSAMQLAQVLRAAWRDPSIRDEFVAQLAVGGDDGTLRRRLAIPGAPRVVRAKTGTLDDAVALSGYVLTADPSRTLIFSVLANGIRGHADEARRRADEIATVVARATQRR
jgi:D-alanyl-D-alanine carboxypeptidase/D-alanyl-D-alanine-endopeptidase (penicillin-binding protein 4)